MTKQRVKFGDCLEVLKSCPDNHFTAVVTDPPYGLSKEPKIEEVLRHWLAGDDYTSATGGFMGKSWDSFVPGPKYWKEIYRVLKPGGFVLCFASTRTFDLMGIALRMAGFVCHPFVVWVTGQGFPKATNLSKQFDKQAGVEREVLSSKKQAVGFDVEKQGGGGWSAGIVEETAPATEAAKLWDGYFYGKQALKPALEPILVFQKPVKGRMTDNALTHGVGGLNIDGCRIAHSEECRMMAPSQANIDCPSEKCRQAGRRVAVLELKPQGRWPANLVWSHIGDTDCPACEGDYPSCKLCGGIGVIKGCVQRGMKKVKGDEEWQKR